jgi:hypothetical protein
MGEPLPVELQDDRALCRINREISLIDRRSLDHRAIHDRLLSIG